MEKHRLSEAKHNDLILETAKSLNVKLGLKQTPIYSLEEAEAWLNEVRTEGADGLMQVLLTGKKRLNLNFQNERIDRMNSTIIRTVLPFRQMLFKTEIQKILKFGKSGFRRMINKQSLKMGEAEKGNVAKIVTTVINKFEKAVRQIKDPLLSHDLFVLVDEGHRSQHGAFNIDMLKTMPNAYYIHGCCSKIRPATPGSSPRLLFHILAFVLQGVFGDG